MSKSKDRQMLKDRWNLLSPPGDTIKETIECLKMSLEEFANRMGQPPHEINDLISGKKIITVFSAIKLEEVLKIDAQFWLNRELSYRKKIIELMKEEFEGD
jgi:addiction module HigA family antidote